MDVKYNIPVFIHHEGNASYLKDCIQQAKKFNKEVVLFGDINNKEMSPVWYDVSGFDSALWREFLKYYSNMSYYPESYAMQIIKRFFVFDDFMDKNNLNECINIDSDVLVFLDFSKLQKLRGYKAALCVPKEQGNMRIAASAGCAYWKKEALHNFCIFCIDVYKNQHFKLEEKWNWHKEHQQDGGVCEMNLLYWWWLKNMDHVWNWIQYNKEGVVDSNYNFSENFLENEYYKDKYNVGKRILIYDKIPYFCSIENGPVKAWAIHFGGGSKIYMHYFRKHLKIAFWIPYVNNVRSKIKKYYCRCFYRQGGKNGNTN